MKKEHAMKWVNALRSGKYKQGRPGFLESDSGYCCLGVLNKLFPKLDLSMGCIGSLPDYAKIGLESSRGHICGWPNSTDITLAKLNDSIDRNGKRMYNFDEIADIIQLEYVEQWAWIR